MKQPYQPGPVIFYTPVTFFTDTHESWEVEAGCTARVITDRRRRTFLEFELFPLGDGEDEAEQEADSVEIELTSEEEDYGFTQARNTGWVSKVQAGDVCLMPYFAYMLPALNDPARRQCNYEDLVLLSILQNAANGHLPRVYVAKVYGYVCRKLLPLESFELLQLYADLISKHQKLPLMPT